MESHPMHQQYIEWNLENTAKILHKKYPQSMIWVVRPNSMSHHTFSVYSAFLASIFNGSPDPTVPLKGQGSWFHLKSLLHNAIDKGITELNKEFSSQKNVDEKDSSNSKGTFLNTSDDNQQTCQDFHRLPIHLVGFSKGCVVLNQLLYDLEQALQDELTIIFIKQVKQMTWLDGGHGGRKNTWVTQKEVLDLLKQTNVRIKVDVTPYQVQDSSRKWIGRDQRQFTAMLRKLGIAVEEKLHFEELEASLDNHFKVLEEF